MSTSRIRGFVAAPFTAMHPDGSINTEIIAAYARHLADSGVMGVFVNGTTGEGYSLTRQERMTTAEMWVAAAAQTSGDSQSRLRVIVHVGAESVADARALAAHAEHIEADAIASMTPVFYSPDLELLIDHCCEIASASSLPFYYYHIPSMTNLYIPVVEFLEAAGKRIPTLHGVKYTHNDLMDFRTCASIDSGKYDVLFGRDEILLSALVLGAEGMVGSTYNYAMPLFTRILAAYQQGKITEAAVLQERVMQFVRILNESGGGTVVGKALMRGVGLDLGPLRSPNRSLTSSEADQLIARVRTLGVFEDLPVTT
jgi:N-acetylneuraminate lyase